MKKTAIFLKTGGLILLALGFILPWYYWKVELMGDKVGANMMGAGGTLISGWQLILPQSLVHEIPASRSQYMIIQGVSSAEVLKEVGFNWTMVPLLVLMLLIAAFVLLFVARTQRQAMLRDGFGSLLIGGCILLMLLLWNPASPTPLEKLELTPAFGKYGTIFGALLLTLSGLIHLLVKPAIEQPITASQVSSETQVPKFRTCLKCHESVATNLDVCPHCRNQMS